MLGESVDDLYGVGGKHSSFAAHLARTRWDLWETVDARGGSGGSIAETRV
jgi:hypothetical protein